jgi:hypothetical protein
VSSELPNLTREEMEDIEEDYSTEDPSIEEVERRLENALGTPAGPDEEVISPDQILSWMFNTARCESPAARAPAGGAPGRDDVIISKWESENLDISYRTSTRCGEEEGIVITFVGQPWEESDRDKFVAVGIITVVSEEDWAVVDHVLDSLNVDPSQVPPSQVAARWR